MNRNVRDSCLRDNGLFGLSRPIHGDAPDDGDAVGYATASTPGVSTPLVWNDHMPRGAMSALPLPIATASGRPAQLTENTVTVGRLTVKSRPFTTVPVYVVPSLVGTASSPVTCR